MCEEMSKEAVGLPEYEAAVEEYEAVAEEYEAAEYLVAWCLVRLKEPERSPSRQRCPQVKESVRFRVRPEVEQLPRHRQC
jgi:hypothetical protein